MSQHCHQKAILLEYSYEKHDFHKWLTYQHYQDGDLKDWVCIEINAQFNGYIEHKEDELRQLKQIIHVLKVTDSKFHHLVDLNSKKQDLTHDLRRITHHGKIVVFMTDNRCHKRAKEEEKVDEQETYVEFTCHRKLYINNLLYKFLFVEWKAFLALEHKFRQFIIIKCIIFSRFPDFIAED